MNYIISSSQKSQESVDEPVTELVDEPVAEPVAEIVDEPVIEPVAEPVAEPVVDRIKNSKCNYPPCLFISSVSGLASHNTRVHVQFSIEVGSFRVTAFPDFEGSLARLRCSNCGELCKQKRMFIETHINSMKCPWCKF